MTQSWKEGCFFCLCMELSQTLSNKFWISAQGVRVWGSSLGAVSQPLGGPGTPYSCYSDMLYASLYLPFLVPIKITLVTPVIVTGIFVCFVF